MPHDSSAQVVQTKAIRRKMLPIALIEKPSVLLGPRFSMNSSVCLQHGTDESAYAPVPPDAVVYPETTEEVAQIAVACNEWRVPIIAFGVGSSVEGHLLAIHGGISIDMSGMNLVLNVRPQDLTATVQAGVTREALNLELSKTGLFFSVDPGANASVGGMAATSASGTNTVRCGAMRENVTSMTVVTADGQIVRTARRAPKSSAGYSLTQLSIGSEGTLGIITEVTVKLRPQPETIAAAVVNFPSVRSAVDTVISAIQMGIPVARAEMLDALTIKAINLQAELA